MSIRLLSALTTDDVQSKPNTLIRFSPLYRALLQKQCPSGSCSFHSYGSFTHSKVPSWVFWSVSSAAKYRLSADGVFSGALLRSTCPGGSEAGPPVAFLLALLLKGSGTRQAPEPPCMAVPGAQAAAAKSASGAPGSTTCGAAGTRHQLRELPSKVPRHRPLKLARSPPNTAGHRFHPPHTLWLSQQQAPTHTTLCLFILEVAMFVALNLLPHMTPFPYDGVAESRTRLETT